MKKVLSILITILLVSSVLIIPTSAAQNAIIAFSANTVTIGNKVTVTVTIDPGVKLYGVEFKLVYDAEKLSYPDAAGSIKVVESPSGDTKFVQQFTFESIAVGAAAFKVEECIYATKEGNTAVEKDFGGASASLTIKDVALSNNTKLTSFTANGVNLSTTKTDQTISVPYEADKVTFVAKPSDNNAKVSGVEPNMPLKVGANTFKITVTAQDGSQKIYTVRITRKEQGAGDIPDDVPDTPDNPHETVISGKNYEIVTTIPEASYLKGFTLSSAEWNGSQIPVLRDKDNAYTVYYLRESGTTEIAPYIYDAELETFETLKHIVLNNTLYIFSDFPEDVAMPSEYYSTYTQIGDYSVKVYMDSNAQMSDFAYAYCYANGDFGLYRYDSKEGTIQRYPDIHFVDAPSTNASQKDNFTTRFASLSTNGKVLLISMLIAALCVVLLVIFLIVMAVQKLSNRSKALPAVADDLSLDDVIIVGENDISSNRK